MNRIDLFNFFPRYKDNVQLNIRTNDDDDDDDGDIEHDNDSNETNDDVDEDRIYMQKIPDKRQWDLVINKAKLNDTGDYKCKIYNSEAITKVRSKLVLL